MADIAVALFVIAVAHISCLVAEQKVLDLDNMLNFRGVSAVGLTAFVWACALLPVVCSQSGRIPLFGVADELPAFFLG